MHVMNLYAELQINPRSIVSYRKISDYYAKINMTNEAEAFLELIRKKFNVDNPSIDKEQSANNPSNT